MALLEDQLLTVGLICETLKTTGAQKYLGFVLSVLLHGALELRGGGVRRGEK